MLLLKKRTPEQAQELAYEPILTHEFLQKHIDDVARAHGTPKESFRGRVRLPDSNASFRDITKCYEFFNNDTDGHRLTVPAAEWLLDNYYIIEKHVKELKQPDNYKTLSKLPVLTEGSSAGVPRVYALAAELVSHTDGSLHEEEIIHLINAYQTQNPLSSDEIWAIPIALRYAVVERVRMLCGKMYKTGVEYQKSEQLIKTLRTLENKDEAKQKALLNERFKGIKNIHPSFLGHLLAHLKKQGQGNAFVLSYIDQLLARQGITAEKLIRDEHNRQSDRQLSIGNAITALRTLGLTDWVQAFPLLSVVEKILSQDPANVYVQMDLTSKNFYRKKIAYIARQTGLSEMFVAQKCIELANQEKTHVGAFILSEQKTKLYKDLGYKAPKNVSGGYYFACMGFFTLFFTLLLFWWTRYSWLVLLVSILPISEAVIHLQNLFFTRFIKPQMLPKLEFEQGIPPEAATMVVIPVLLSSPSRAKALSEQLEAFYLANREDNLYFTLLGDYKDGKNQHEPTDQAVYDTAKNIITQLNEKYKAQAPIFYYLQRNRTYQAQNKQWGGYERKRGALLCLNDLLLGGTPPPELHCSATVPQVTYCITLDADTLLVKDMAKRLIGTIHHPLHRAVVDEKKGIVTAGYGLIQPRIFVHPESASASFFARVFAGQGGIDPYSHAVSDLYQDVFHEGIFTGKGIYNVQVCQQILASAIPDNTVLSHDLLEGSYIRTGLATDLYLIDGYPAQYQAHSGRQHRWTRGDWQLLPWLFPHVRNKAGIKVKNPLSAVSKWKIKDNLRRSLLPVALFLMLTLGFGVLPYGASVWLILAFLIIGSTLITASVDDVLARNYRYYNEKRHAPIIIGLEAVFWQVFLSFTFLPDQVRLMADAIGRTLYRLFFSHSHMLEWVTAADAEGQSKNTATSYYARMSGSVLLAALPLIVAFYYGATAWKVALLLFVWWALAPLIAWHISKLDVREIVLNATYHDELRQIIRKTWEYFEAFTRPSDHYLPPDNVQLDPPNGIAHRTSPTNIGLGLLACLGAYDMGYVSVTGMIERIGKTLATIENLEKWHGHLYNWYDTRTLRTLRPRYISTVDSGNFLCMLMTLTSGLPDAFEHPLLGERQYAGIRDCLLLAGVQNIPAMPATTKDWQAIFAIKEQLVESELWALRAKQTIADFEHEVISHYPDWQKRDSLPCPLALKQALLQLIERLQKIVTETQLSPLYDPKKELFSIGYNIEEEKLTRSYYDLMASEARQTSLIAIARGEVPQKHWFKLGRNLTNAGGYKGLVSWTGTMFEYLMPLILIKNLPNTLWDETYRFITDCQKRYGAGRQVPWGVSESGYYAFDRHLNYQYKAFGVPVLGLKRGLVDDTVIAPYAAMLALMTDPNSAMRNLAHLRKLNAECDYGFFEAVDFTKKRTLKGEKYSIVKNIMVHHQGMALLSAVNCLHDNIMQKRFHRLPEIKSVEYLLMEKIPYHAAVTKGYREKPETTKVYENIDPHAIRQFGTPHEHLPHAHLLSNGNYSMMLTDSGTGYSKWGNIAINRYRGQEHQQYGQFVFVRDIHENRVWSATHAPFSEHAERYRVVFHPHKAEYERKDGSIETHMQVVVSPEDDVEIRTVTLSNHGDTAKTLDVTVYFEPILGPQNSDLAHPAFSNLFVRTEFDAQCGCLLANRRPRSPHEPTTWVSLSYVTESQIIGNVQYETDRSKFIGRGRSIANPLVLLQETPLQNTVGAVLDPCMSLRLRAVVEPESIVRFDFMTAVADNREQVIRMGQKYRNHGIIERMFELALSRSRVEHKYLALETPEQEAFSELLRHILFLSPLRRFQASMIEQNVGGQRGLWAIGVSGDLPIMVITISSTGGLEIVKQAIKSHEYFRMKGLSLDLVILEEEEGSYTQPLSHELSELISVSHARELLDQTGGVFVRAKKNTPPQEWTRILSAACIVVSSSAETLKGQLKYKVPHENLNPPARQMLQEPHKPVTPPLAFDNGWGGFSEHSHVYHIRQKIGECTPLPWSNVLCNERFGTLVTESGGGYTWCHNSRENKLTPWRNDPVSDPPSETIYIRNEENGTLFTPTPKPIGGNILVTHGFGYTVYEGQCMDLETQLTVFVPLDDKVKISLLRMKNLQAVEKKLTTTYYIRPVLGVFHEHTAPHLVSTKVDHFLCIRNAFTDDFTNQQLVMGVTADQITLTGDNEEFLGLKRDVKNPLALAKKTLSGRLGAGYDPCGAMMGEITLAPNAETTVVFVLGQADNADEVQTLAKYLDVNFAKQACTDTKAFWLNLLGTLTVNTPDVSVNKLLGGWALYQTIACRMWAKSAFYQSGGAFGFRDQLQDSLAVLYVRPAWTKAQILKHAAHQFEEGDVQHWWHEIAGSDQPDRGIRTRFSDDLCWLPYAVCAYLQATDDRQILHEIVPFLKDAPLKEGEDERYGVPSRSAEMASLYTHCTLALDRALHFGVHGLPLMGSGDWNDGMNTVGNLGKGESVWMGWFLVVILKQFTSICDMQDDMERKTHYLETVDVLLANLQQHAWDGNWYRRAFFDDGTPLGSAQNAECQIDSLAQSWAVIAGQHDPKRTEQAMSSLSNYLISKDDGIIKLLTPAFDACDLEPGYIKSYLPGVRENGGQYTHAAIWVVMAFAMMGKAEQAWEAFQMLNPIHHTRTQIEASTYKAEPYVLAADVYTVQPHIGRGGWTWYTGAAGWYYTVGIQLLLGFQKRGQTLHINPLIPAEWEKYSLTYHHEGTIYDITIENPHGVSSGVEMIRLDGQVVTEIPLVQDGKVHVVVVTLKSM
ncbi:MAG: glycosyl transferase [Hyphomonadaceae bacterium]|nr:glycosyl transferase [Clostridia bacterium]